METHPDDKHYMLAALTQAEQASRHDEVPVGAVVVYRDRVIGSGHNLTRRLQDATAHAEILALREAAVWLGHWHFEHCTLYVTVEPCVMCAGAMILHRVGRLVYGAPEPKFGACGSLYNLVDDPRLNHRLAVTRGVLETECAELMQKFFRGLREGG
ncbi:MAG TPA: tRNA adenosine(34) deaminase TadA [archaeon]|nr:tRNA adenosine(34) deaminase TadA [archaeon]